MSGFRVLELANRASPGVCSRCQLLAIASSDVAA
jgi:hypothetical protein